MGRDDAPRCATEGRERSGPTVKAKIASRTRTVVTWGFSSTPARAVMLTPILRGGVSRPPWHPQQRTEPLERAPQLQKIDTKAKVGSYALH